jgi:hypothetical protein
MQTEALLDQCPHHRGPGLPATLAQDQRSFGIGLAPVRETTTSIALAITLRPLLLLLPQLEGHQPFGAQRFVQLWPLPLGATDRAQQSSLAWKLALLTCRRGLRFRRGFRLRCTSRGSARSACHRSPTHSWLCLWCAGPLLDLCKWFGSATRLYDEAPLHDLTGSFWLQRTRQVSYDFVWTRRAVAESHQRGELAMAHDGAQLRLRL